MLRACLCSEFACDLVSNQIPFLLKYTDRFSGGASSILNLRRFERQTRCQISFQGGCEPTLPVCKARFVVRMRSGRICMVHRRRAAFLLILCPFFLLCRKEKDDGPAQHLLHLLQCCSRTTFTVPIHTAFCFTAPPLATTTPRLPESVVRGSATSD